MTTKHPRDMSREEFARAIQAPWVGTDFAVARASQALEELVRRNPKAPVPGLNAKLQRLRLRKGKHNLEKILNLAIQLAAECREWAEQAEPAAAD